MWDQIVPYDLIKETNTHTKWFQSLVWWSKLGMDK